MEVPGGETKKNSKGAAVIFRGCQKTMCALPCVSCNRKENSSLCIRYAPELEQAKKLEDIGELLIYFANIHYQDQVLK